MCAFLTLNPAVLLLGAIVWENIGMNEHDDGVLRSGLALTFFSYVSSVRESK